jgi:putative peptidoglycan lipid II flippase
MTPPSAGRSGLARLPGRLIASLPRGALLLAALTLASYLMGLVRDRVFARTFGAGSDLDVYNAALVLPELALDVLVVAGLSSAFVPVFARLRRDDTDVTQEFSRTVLNASILLMLITVAVLFVLAPQTVQFVAPGFDEQQQVLYTELFRVMCVTAVIFAASFALGEMLVVRQRFLAYGLAPVLYNAGIVFGALALAPTMGVLGIAVGTVIGALMHLAVRALEVGRTDFRYRPSIRLRTPGFREYVRLAIPKALAQPIEPLTFLYFTSVASGLAAGSISALSFARNFGSVPVSLIGVAFSVAAFPVMAAAAADADGPRFRRLVVTNLGLILALAVAAAVGLVLVGGLAVEVFLGGGAFDAEDVATTTLLLGAFALSVPLEAAAQLLARAIYSTRNTILPVIASLAGLAVTVVTVQWLSESQDIVALPLGYGAGQAARVLLLLVFTAARARNVGVPASVSTDA